MATTTEYGAFVDYAPDAISVANMHDYIAGALAEWADDYDLPGIISDYREAINRALTGTGVTLLGDLFYGPIPKRDIDIQAAITGIDFWALAEKHDQRQKGHQQ